MTRRTSNVNFRDGFAHRSFNENAFLNARGLLLKTNSRYCTSPNKKSVLDNSRFEPHTQREESVENLIAYKTICFISIKHLADKSWWHQAIRTIRMNSHIMMTSLVMMMTINRVEEHPAMPISCKIGRRNLSTSPQVEFGMIQEYQNLAVGNQRTQCFLASTDTTTTKSTASVLSVPSTTASIILKLLKNLPLTTRTMIWLLKAATLFELHHIAFPVRINKRD